MIIPVKAQVTSSGANAVRYTSYPSLPSVHDPVFIFCNSTGNVKGSVSAVSPGGSGPFTFSWYQWSDATRSFSVFIRTDVNATLSALTGLNEGGYLVHISDGFGYSTDLRCWIHLDIPYAEAKLKHFTCDYVALAGKALPDTFLYRDPSNGNNVKLKNGVEFLWTSNPTSPIPYPNIELNPVTFNPPLVDVVYNLQVKDSFLCVSQSSFPYTSIHVNAEFDPDPEKGEAPLEVSFTDKSIRGSIYRWEFGDDSVSTSKEPPPHTYYKPGEYTVKLIIESDLHCIDSVKFESIVVEPSQLDIPNVFTPDGDGINDYFVVEAKSLRTINVEIYSRSGILVYSFRGEGQRLTEWQGWDGNINNSSRKATPGVYFYVIKAVGWDDKIYDNKAYRGFFYLYR
ncbi:MAG: gliding motility-associated C-terminal domain-containing protein [Bacteroidales bacterium]